MRTEEILQQIDSLPGMEEFKALCRRIHTASENASRLLLEKAPLPNLIFAAAPGCGITLHIRLLAELLKSLRLLQFTGEEEYFEWALTDNEKSFDRFLLRVKKAGGFYGQFRGVIGLDISEMISRDEPLPEMGRLMEYVDARQGKIVFAFIIPEDASERTIRQLLGQFASITPAELVRMPFPAQEARMFVAEKLRSRGYRLTEGASRLLQEAVACLSATEEFEGYQTLNNLTDDVIWRKLSSGAMKDTTICKADLAFIFAEDGYCSQLNAYSHRLNKRRVGFGADLEG